MSIPRMLIVAAVLTLPAACNKADPSEQPKPAETPPTRHAEDSKPNVEHRDVTEESSLSDSDRGTISKEAVSVVERIKEARAAIRDGKHVQARRDLTKARSNLEDIARRHPTVAITKKVWDEREKYEKKRSEQVKSEITTVPVEADVTTLPFYVRERPWGFGSNDPEDSKKLPQRVSEDMLMYTEVDLPVTMTYMAVLGAEKLAEEGKWKGVDEVLSRALAGMDIVVAATEGPLTQLRVAVWHAMGAAVGGKLDEARTQLRRATDIVAKLSKAQDTEGAVKEEVAAIEKELHGIEEAFDRGEAQPKSARHLMERIWALGQRWVARMNVAKMDLQLRHGLADALWRLDLAESDVAEGRLGDAGGELLRARDALEKTKKTADAATLPVVQGVLDQLASLEPITDHARDETFAGLGDAQARLREVLFALIPPPPVTVASADRDAAAPDSTR